MGWIKWVFQFTKVGGRKRDVWSSTTKTEHSRGATQSKHPLLEPKKKRLSCKVSLKMWSVVMLLLPWDSPTHRSAQRQNNTFSEGMQQHTWNFAITCPLIYYIFYIQNGDSMRNTSSIPYLEVEIIFFFSSTITSCLWLFYLHLSLQCPGNYWIGFFSSRSVVGMPYHQDYERNIHIPKACPCDAFLGKF